MKILYATFYKYLDYTKCILFLSFSHLVGFFLQFLLSVLQAFFAVRSAFWACTVTSTVSRDMTNNINLIFFVLLTWHWWGFKKHLLCPDTCSATCTTLRLSAKLCDGKKVIKFKDVRWFDTSILLSHFKALKYSKNVAWKQIFAVLHTSINILSQSGFHPYLKCRWCR